MVNPGTDVTFGNVKAVLHVLAGAIIVGASGKITTLVVLLTHVEGAARPAGMVSHGAASTYRACIV